MRPDMIQQATEYNKKRKRHKRWQKIVTCLGAAVVFCTTYALILPAITMEHEQCQLPEHMHSSNCYTQVVSYTVTELICPLDNLGIHEHSADCYNDAGDILCGYADFVVHQHDASCYSEDGDFWCPVPEVYTHTHDTSCYSTSESAEEANSVESHTHDESCYTKIRSELLCEFEESEGHAHDDACYTETQGGLICTTEESEGHAHSDTCYAETSTLSCEVPESEEHAHTEECYTVTSELTCGTEESEGHVHNETCYEAISELTCTLEEIEGHTHTDDCYAGDMELTCTLPEGTTETIEEALPAEEPDAEPELTCTKEEIILHTHSEECFDETGALVCGMIEIQEHIHDESCFMNVEVPVDTENLTCTLAESDGHAHDETCYDETGTPVCMIEEAEGHWHTELCCGMWELTCNWIEHTHNEYCFPEETEPTDDTTVTEEEEYFCGFETHLHDELCYGTEGNLICTLEEHEHTEACLTEEVVDETKYFCGTEAHLHDELCYDTEGNLICTLEEHEHTEECLTEETVDETEYFCGTEAHLHDELCYDTEGNLICTLEEHEHTEECLTEETVDETEYFCGTEAHLHDELCYDTEGNLICSLEEHEHTEECLTEKVVDETEYFCGIEAHLHDELCYSSEGILVCTLTEHEHTEKCKLSFNLTAQEQAQVDEVIALIDSIPSANEIDTTMMAYEAAEDYEGEEAWLTEVYQQIAWVYQEYSNLPEELQAAVTNADKLMELEYIWSMMPMISGITSDSPTTIKAASTSDFIELNLYNYGSNINTKYESNNKYPGFQWNGGAYHKNGSTYSRQKIDFIDFGNSMITDFDYVSSASGTNGKSSNSQNITSGGTGINAIDNTSYGVTNRPIGMSLNGSITDTDADVLSRTLGSDGYPALKDGTSLSYLFTNGTYANKQNSSSIDGLFQQNTTTGEYYYNSRENHAQYSNNKFTLYNQIITPNFITYPFGNFLPFNTITDSSKATQVSKIQRVVSGSGSYTGYIQAIINRLLEGSEDSTENQLIDMLAKYRDNLGAVNATSSKRYTWTAADAINDYFGGDGDNPSDAITFSMSDALLKKMYNIDFDVDTDFFFGMEMKMNFMQPKGGYTGNDTNGDGESDYPMEFYFTGDDDVWVYIDDVLFLDLSGIHRHVGGKIDFVNGKVHYYYLDTANTGDVSSTPYQSFTFAEILSAAGKSTSGLNSNGTFQDYTTHSFKFYYTERGSGSSVCRMNFNFPLLRKNTISVEKDVTSDTTILGDPDYKFQVLKANSNGTKTEELFIAAGTPYTIYDENDNVIGGGTTDANGVFTLKAGQRAEFAGIDENAGKYYVRELLEGTVLEQYGNVTVSGATTTTSYDVTVGNDTFTGMDSPVKDMSDGATSFRFTNDVDETKLGILSLTKTLTEYSSARTVKYFDFQVTLDGEPLPVGTEYTVGDEARTVTTAGIITIAADEMAVITNFLAGTQFVVQETSGSAEGYTVTYSDSGGYTITVKDGAVNGTVKTSAHVQLVINNSEKGTTLTIPGTKSLTQYDGTERTFTFRLTEVTDSTGATEKDGGLKDYTAVATVGNGPGAFSFPINYVEVDEESLPAKFYYRITEDAHEDALTNSTSYVAEVTVTKPANDLVAEITGMWKDGTAISNYSADFTNTLVGDLTLSKTVVGGSTDAEFSFSIALTPGTSSLSTLPTTYPAVFYQQDGTVENDITLSVNSEGLINLTGFKHGEKAVIHGIPQGAAWTITETTANGYTVTTEVTAGETITPGTGTETSGTIDIGGTTVAYTNSLMYELPETGGAGTHWYMMGGLLLMAAAGLYLLYHKTRRKEDAASP